MLGDGAREVCRKPGIKHVKAERQAERGNSSGRKVTNELEYPTDSQELSVLYGAGDGDRTRDIQLGKLAFYR